MSGRHNTGSAPSNAADVSPAIDSIDSELEVSESTGLRKMPSVLSFRMFRNRLRQVTTRHKHMIGCFLALQDTTIVAHRRNLCASLSACGGFPSRTDRQTVRDNDKM